MIYDVYQAYKELPFLDDGSITILSKNYIYPYNWDKPGKNEFICSAQLPTFNATACKMNLITEDTVCLTYWSKSWDIKDKNLFLNDKSGI